MSLRVVNRTRGRVLGDRVAHADRWWPRLRGLLGREALRAGEGLLLTPCRSIHMIGMRHAIDVVFLAADGTVVATYPGVKPGFQVRGHPRARHALELPVGTIEASGTRPGDRLEWTRAAAGGPHVPEGVS